MNFHRRSGVQTPLSLGAEATDRQLPSGQPAYWRQMMGRFFTGLILGFLLGAVAVGYNPGLAERMHAVLAGVTATILRGTEETAEAVGEAAKEAADEAEQAADEPDVDAEPTTPEAAEETRQSAEEAAEETAEAEREAAEEVEREAEGLDERPATDRQ